jgi:hypothetical protein
MGGCVTALLGLGAAALLIWTNLALGREDVEALESPLVLPIAAELTAGPWRLYGPYGGDYPFVLIHAPLYYHLAALLARPLARAGVDAVTAALAAGRALSAVGLVVALIATYHLARVDGAGPAAGWWAVLLAAATPVHGGLPFAVRPDMLGIGFQTTGVLLVMRALGSQRPSEAIVLAAYACFAMAACIKQLFVMAPLLSTCLLLAAACRGRLALAAVGRAVALAAFIVFCCYGAEQWVTAGRMSQALITAARNVTLVHPADWSFATNIFLALTWKCAGVILLALAAGTGLLLVQPTVWRRTVAGLATALVALVVALEAAQLYSASMAISASIVIVELAAIALVVPAGIVWERRAVFGSRIDAALGLYLLGELALVAVLSRQSTGAWYNYALQAAIFAAVLSARAVWRAFETARAARTLVAVLIAALAVPLFAFTDATAVANRKRVEGALLDRVVQRLKRPGSEIFFIDRPGDNRVRGRIDLVYDQWLYPVFETIGLAEPRSVWLGRALSAGPVRAVVTASSSAAIDGIPRSLPALGYRLSFRTGPFWVWER